MTAIRINRTARENALFLPHGGPALTEVTLRTDATLMPPHEKQYSAGTARTAPRFGSANAFSTAKAAMTALLVAAAAGCSSQGVANGAAPARTARIDVSAPTEAPTATKDDLEHAVGNLRTCLATKGVGLVNSGWDPTTQQRMILSFPAPGMPDDTLTEAVDSCRGEHLDEVEARYVASHPPEMAPPLRMSILTCLKNRGIDAPASIRSPDDLLQSVPTGKRRDLETCALDSLERLHPDLPSYSFP